MILFVFDCLWGAFKETFTDTTRQKATGEMDAFFCTNKFLLFMASS